MQLTAKELYENAISWRDVFTEVPIKIANSPLITALTAQLDEAVPLGMTESTRLRMNALPFLERQLERIGDGIDNLHGEMQDISAFERARARQEQQKALWLQRRLEVRLAMPACVVTHPPLCSWCSTAPCVSDTFSPGCCTRSSLCDAAMLSSLCDAAMFSSLRYATLRCSLRYATRLCSLRYATLRCSLLCKSRDADEAPSWQVTERLMRTSCCMLQHAPLLGVATVHAISTGSAGPSRKGGHSWCVLQRRHRLGQLGQGDQHSNTDSEQGSNTDWHSARKEAQAAQQLMAEPGAGV